MPLHRYPNSLARALATGVLLLLPVTVWAQGSAPPADAGQGGDVKNEAPQKIDEMTEAALALKGIAGSPECVWFGRRIVSLMFRDDLDTAARHREIYERFGCPQGQVQAAFRCMARQGELDPKAPEALSSRVHTCWINPDGPPPAATPAGTEAAGAPPATP